jgi:rRNA maturation endonuclease Nob1
VRKKKVEWSNARIKGRLPPQLMRCPGCGQHLYPQAKTCPHCGGELRVLRKRVLKSLAKAQAALERLQRTLEKAE